MISPSISVPSTGGRSTSSTFAPTASISSVEMGLSEGPVDGEWIRRGGTALLRTLRASDPADSMWAWGSDQHVRFWSRRQLHETLVHRFDLELAEGGRPSRLHNSLPTQSTSSSPISLQQIFSPRSHALEATAKAFSSPRTRGGYRWTVELHPDRFDVLIGQHAATATLSGSAVTLSLVLYRRLTLGSTDLGLEAAHDLVDFWIANSALE